MSVVKPNYCTPCHVCEEEMLNRHKTDLATLIQGLHAESLSALSLEKIEQ